MKQENSMPIFDSVLDAVGGTPLIRLRRMAPEHLTVAVKFEATNPGSSIKDRIAVALIEAAERDGRLQPGGTVIEATAGNTGIGLAMVAAVKGYRALFVVPDKMSADKVRVLEAYGARIVRARSDVPFDHPEAYQPTARRLAREMAGGCYIGQFEQMANPAAHYASTGPEIWAGTGGRVTHLVAGAGTGGTLTGTARYLKEQNAAITVVGADPVGSLLHGGDVAPFLVEGIGEDYVPDTFEAGLVDVWHAIPDAESFATARALARLEGVFAGGSAGTALAAALREVDRAASGSLLVVILADTGRNYLSGFYNREWLREHCPAALAYEQAHWPLPIVDGSASGGVDMDGGEPS
jgi:cystathionine beta-synthase